MARPIRLLPLFLIVLGAAPACRAESNPLPELRAGRWGLAQGIAATAPDAVAEKLVTYLRMLTPGAATPGEISRFMAENPDWPSQTLLDRRRQEAITDDPDSADLIAACGVRPITLPGALARCASVEADSGDSPAAEKDAREAWRSGLAAPQSQAFLKRFGAILSPADDQARFEQLAWGDPPAAAAEIPRLPAATRQAAHVRIALAQGGPDALAKAQALPPAESSSPGFVLDEARALRRAQRDSEALKFWKDRGFAAEAADPSHHDAFWAERNILARALLGAGDPQGAFLMADDQSAGASVANTADAAFLSGFIALRRLHDPSLAMDRFNVLASVSKAAITQGRAQYWLGRAQQEAGQSPQKAFEAAAAWPTTFYGQIAAHALGKDPAAEIKALSDPGFTAQQAWDFSGHELVRAALILIAWGEQGRARAFLLRMNEITPDPRSQALCARLALALGMPDTAVFIARHIGLQGGMLPDAGWPMPVDRPVSNIDPAVVLAVIRQESSFDHGVVSAAGARGLMQLMPGTARQAGGTGSDPASLTDPGRNMAIGENVLTELLAQFEGSLPLAVAAYNAGPGKVQEWLAKNGDPRNGAIDMIDWIELIGFGETRNYVQRVLENAVIYCARRNEPDTSLIAQWMASARHEG